MMNTKKTQSIEKNLDIIQHQLKILTDLATANRTDIGDIQSTVKKMNLSTLTFHDEMISKLDTYLTNIVKSAVTEIINGTTTELEAVAGNPEKFNEMISNISSSLSTVIKEVVTENREELEELISDNFKYIESLITEKRCTASNKSGQDDKNVKCDGSCNHQSHTCNCNHNDKKEEQNKSTDNVSGDGFGVLLISPYGSTESVCHNVYGPITSISDLLHKLGF